MNFTLAPYVALTMLVRMLCVVMFVSILSGCLQKNVEQFQIIGNSKDASYSVIVVAPPAGISEATLKTQIEDELEHIASLISTSDPESELSQFNASESTEWTLLAKETVELIQTSRRVSKASGGAYDVTLASVAQLWGFADGDSDSFFADSPAQPRPSLDEILEIMNQVGYQLLLVSGSEVNVRKLSPKLKVDLTSLGNGYAVDRVGEILEASGVDRYQVDIGGEIRTRGRAADGNMWKVNIEVPQTEQQNTPVGVELENAHVSTSGDFRQYREVDGVRVAQLLDGRTGYPIDHTLASVTLLHGSAALADAWASAFLAMGYDEALKMAEEKGMAAQFTVREGNGFRVHSTSTFEAYAYVDK